MLPSGPSFDDSQKSVILRSNSFQPAVISISKLEARFGILHGLLILGEQIPALQNKSKEGPRRLYSDS